MVFDYFSLQAYHLYDFDSDQYLGPPAYFTTEEAEQLNRGLARDNYSHFWILA
jgi:hypothetical protein